MKVFPQCLLLALSAIVLTAFSGCNRTKQNDRPATVSTVEKEKHTKTKAHKRDKKKEKEKEKAGGGKQAPKPTPEKPA